MGITLGLVPVGVSAAVTGGAAYAGYLLYKLPGAAIGGVAALALQYLAGLGIFSAPLYSEDYGYSEGDGYVPPRDPEGLDIPPQTAPARLLRDLRGELADREAEEAEDRAMIDTGATAENLSPPDTGLRLYPMHGSGYRNTRQRLPPEVIQRRNMPINSWLGYRKGYRE
jgi:hypothetical protein